MWDYSIDEETNDIQIDSTGDIAKVGSHLNSDSNNTVIQQDIQYGLYSNEADLLSAETDTEMKKIIRTIFESYTGRVIEDLTIETGDTIADINVTFTLKES
jgi:hypothetical protein